MLRLMLIRAFWFALGALIAFVRQEMRYAPMLPEIKMREDEDHITWQSKN